MGDRSGRLMRLRPVTFVYKNDLGNTRQYGLIAEEVRQVYPELVTYDQQGRVESVRYEQLIPMLLNELQMQRAQIAQQDQQIARYERALDFDATAAGRSGRNHQEAGRRPSIG
jgi:hypothetical protein